jgi:hypothetical protein
VIAWVLPVTTGKTLPDGSLIRQGPVLNGEAGLMSSPGAQTPIAEDTP